MRSSLAVKNLRKVTPAHLKIAIAMAIFLIGLVWLLRSALCDMHRPRCPANLSLTGRGQPPLGSKGDSPRSNLETVTNT